MMCIRLKTLSLAEPERELYVFMHVCMYVTVWRFGVKYNNPNLQNDRLGNRMTANVATPHLMTPIQCIQRLTIPVLVGCFTSKFFHLLVSVSPYRPSLPLPDRTAK